MCFKSCLPDITIMLVWNELRTFSKTRMKQYIDNISFFVLLINSNYLNPVKTTATNTMLLVYTPQLRLWLKVQEYKAPDLKNSAIPLQENMLTVRDRKMLQEVSWRHSRGQEVDPCHQTKLPGQGHKGLGRELSLLLALIESEITEFFSGVSLRGKVLKIMSM